MTEQTEIANIQNLQSTDAKIRYKAALDLARSGNFIGVKILCEAVDSLAWDDINLYEVIEVLGEIGDEDSVNTLVAFLEHFRGHARGGVLESLLRIGTENAVKAVFEELRTPSPWFGWGTAQLIAESGEKFLPQLLQAS